MNAALRDSVRLRAENRCEYCRLAQRHSPLALQVEHIIAKQHRGTDDPVNLALACDRCNLHKGPNLSGIDPATGQIVTLFNPRTQVWQEHFTLEGAAIVGTTSTGRATVQLLDMNAPRRLRLRTALISRDEWK